MPIGDNEQGGCARASWPRDTGHPVEFLDVGTSHGGSWRRQSSWSSRCLAGCATGRSSTVEVAAAPPAVRVGSEPAFQLHQAPNPGAVGAEIGSTFAAASLMMARSTPSSSAPVSSGAAIGRPRSGSCQVPTATGYRTHVRDRIGNAHLARLNESVAAPPPSAVRDDAAGRFRLWSRGSGAAGRQIGSNRCP